MLLKSAVEGLPPKSYVPTLPFINVDSTARSTISAAFIGAIPSLGRTAILYFLKSLHVTPKSAGMRRAISFIMKPTPPMIVIPMRQTLIESQSASRSGLIDNFNTLAHAFKKDFNAILLHFHARGSNWA